MSETNETQPEIEAAQTDPALAALHNEMKAMRGVDRALAALSLNVQRRVLDWAMNRLGETIYAEQQKREGEEKLREEKLRYGNGSVLNETCIDGRLGGSRAVPDLRRDRY